MDKEQAEKLRNTINQLVHEMNLRDQLREAVTTLMKPHYLLGNIADVRVVHEAKSNEVGVDYIDNTLSLNEIKELLLPYLQTKLDDTEKAIDELEVQI